MLDESDRLKITQWGAGEAAGRYAIKALVVVIIVRWIALALAAQALSMPIRMFFL